MRAWLHIVLVCVFACGVSACGNKSKLKSPTQIEVQEEKKARREAKKGVLSPEGVVEALPEVEVKEKWGQDGALISVPSNEVIK
ncbi:MAG: hypothetical protein K2Q01_10750 [Rickettsiales bacterium]|nr:hypothetical protein [Rickettsiales bacterium]